MDGDDPSYNRMMTTIQQTAEEPYTTPELKVYGTVADLTRTTGSKGPKDNAAGETRTH